MIPSGPTALDPRLLRIAEGLARSAAARRWADPHELLSDALMAAWTAQKAFDPSRGTPIEGWVGLCVSRALKRRNRTRAESEKTVSLHAIEERTCPRPRPGEPSEYQSKNEFWRRAVAGMEQPVADTVAAVYRRGLSIAEAAATLGASEAAIYKRLERALPQLRRNLAAYSRFRIIPGNLSVCTPRRRKVGGRRTPANPSLHRSTA